MIELLILKMKYGMVGCDEEYTLTELDFSLFVFICMWGEDYILRDIGIVKFG